MLRRFILKKTKRRKNERERIGILRGVPTLTMTNKVLWRRKRRRRSLSRDAPKIYIEENKTSKKHTREDRDTPRCTNTNNDKQSPLEKKKTKKISSSRDAPKIDIEGNRTSKKRTREDRDTSRCTNTTNDKQSPLEKKKTISERTSKVDFVDDNTTKKRTRDNRDTNAAIQKEDSWSVEEHSRFMFMVFMYGCDFAKIATCMPTRNSTQIRAYAFSAFNGECIRYWSVDDYSVLIEKASKEWIQIDGWNKEEVVEKIRNKPDLEQGTTVAERKANLNAKQSFVYERSQTHESDTESEQDFPLTDFDKTTETNKKSNHEDKKSQSFSNSVHASRESFQETRIESDDLRPSRRKSIEINHNDVILLERNSRFQTQNHPGNFKFQQLCSSRKEQYFQENGKKNSIVRTIVDSIASMNPPGRFLQYDRDSEIWFRASDNEAVQMTHAIFKNMEIVADAKNDVQEARMMKTKKYLFELASHNKPAPTDDGIRAIFAAATSGRRPKRQRQSVTFFEPNAMSRKPDNDGDDDDDCDSIETRKTGRASRKRRRESADTATADLPSKRSSRSRSSRIQRDRGNKDKKSSRERKRNRVSQKATRRLISNALAGFLQRQGTAKRSTDGYNRESC